MMMIMIVMHAFIITMHALFTVSLGTRAYSYAHFGRGTGPILMAYVGCRGEETHLANCSRSTPYCSHYEDAGVRCPGKLECLPIMGKHMISTRI